MVKLSKLKDDEMILISQYGYGDGLVMSKGDYLNEIGEHKGRKIYTTMEHKAHIDAREMIESAIEYEYQNMYEDWYDKILQDVTEDDIKDMQVILNRILSGSNNIAYLELDEIEIDI